METVSKEQYELRKKCEKLQETIRKLNAELHSKYSAITELRSRIEHSRTIENSKEMKLTWSQNRMKFTNVTVEELKWKLQEFSVSLFTLLLYIGNFSRKTCLKFGSENTI